MFTCGFSQCKKRKITGDIPKAIFISRGFVRQVSDLIKMYHQLFKLVLSQYAWFEGNGRRITNRHVTKMTEKGGIWISLLRALSPTGDNILRSFHKPVFKDI